MGRRSDHTHAEIRNLFISEGHRHMSEVGFARFSARQVSQRVGYVIGTMYNVFETLDAVIFAINTRTFDQWANQMRDVLDRAGDDRIAAMVRGYFAFARENRNLWNAIYDHHVPVDFRIPEDQAGQRGRLTIIVADEVAKEMTGATRERVEEVTRSLIATVHGHCAFAMNGSFALMGERDPEGAAIARVRQSLNEEAIAATARG